MSLVQNWMHHTKNDWQKLNRVCVITGIAVYSSILVNRHLADGCEVVHPIPPQTCAEELEPDKTCDSEVLRSYLAEKNEHKQDCTLSGYR